LEDILGEFKEEAQLVQQTDLKQYQTYLIDVDKSMVFNKEDSIRYHLEDINIGNRTIVDNYDNGGPFRDPRSVSFEIVKSLDNKASITATYESQGRDFQTALKHVQNIDYKFVQKDSSLVFSPNIQFKKNMPWRDQSVHIQLRIPVGSRVLINENTHRYWSFYQYYWCRDSQGEHKEPYRESIMTEDGLKCRYDLENPENQ
jgi:hypothetical protein